MRARWILGSLAIVAGLTIAFQFWLNIDQRGTVFRAARSFFSFFTIWTNIAVALTAGWLALRSEASWRRWEVSMISAVTLFIVFVGVVYHALLSGDHNPTGVPAVTNVLLHYVIPIAMLAAWLTIVPKGRLRLADPVVWLAYPLTYLAFAMVRGALIGSYPYFFLNADFYGLGGVALHAVGLCFSLLVMGMGLVGLDQLFSTQKARLQTPT